MGGKRRGGTFHVLSISICSNNVFLSLSLSFSLSLSLSFSLSHSLSLSHTHTLSIYLSLSLTLCLSLSHTHSLSFFLSFSVGLIEEFVAIISRTISTNGLKAAQTRSSKKLRVCIFFIFYETATEKTLGNIVTSKTLSCNLDQSQLFKLGFDF